VAVAAPIVLAVLGLLYVEVVRTRPVRNAIRCYAALMTAANGQDLAAAERLCTRRYRRSHHLRLADEGGIVGLPRNIHKNFRAWRRGAEVWLCPTNRVGPVYRFIPEDGGWKFDGPIGLLTPDGQVVPMAEGTDPIE
jgi:hypothetical protein